MDNTQRPGVFSSYEVMSSVSSGSGGAVGIAARVPGAAGADVRRIGSYADAVADFGKDSGITELIRVLFLNGASSVVAAPVREDANAEDYANSFEKFKNDETVKLIVCDSQATDIHTAMKECILSFPEISKYCMGIAEAAPGTVSNMISVAEALNCERMVLVPGESSGGIAGTVAAALAGIISAGQDPALPLNGAELLGLAGFEHSFSDAEISWLIEGGVTPVENSMGSVYAVRGITTRTKTQGASDTTWRELTTVLIMDDVITTIRANLRSRFSRTKNTAQTRGAIRTQVLIDLENKKAREVIDGYGDITVQASESDPTVCDVSFEFTVAHGLNQIRLMAYITV